jgi:hypothetical protein
MNRLQSGDRAAIIRALARGMSVGATAMLTGTAKATVLKLMLEIGEFCSIYQDKVLVNLPCERIEADEIWAFVGLKERNRTHEGQGDIWTFTALCATTRLMVSWVVGRRSTLSACAIIDDVASRMRNRVQMTTDSHWIYTTAVEHSCGGNNVDITRIDKSNGHTQVAQDPLRRYRSVGSTVVRKRLVIGEPDMVKISTSYLERTSLNMKMDMRRFTGGSNANSRKAENHAHALSLFFMLYNFCKPHLSLTKAAKGINTTPAMAAKITEHVWTVEEILAKMTERIGQHSLQSN